MSERQLTAEDYAVKAAFRDLIERVGGVLRAAELAGRLNLGCNQSRISNYCSPNDTSLPRLDVIRVFEREAGAPLVTRVVAEQAGYRLVPDCEAQAAASLTASVVTAFKESGEALSAIAPLATGAAPSPADIPRTIRELEEDVRAKVCLIEELRQLAESGKKIAQFRRA